MRKSIALVSLLVLASCSKPGPYDRTILLSCAARMDALATFTLATSQNASGEDKAKLVEMAGGYTTKAKAARARAEELFRDAGADAASATSQASQIYDTTAAGIVEGRKLKSDNDFAKELLQQYEVCKPQVDALI